MAHAQGQDKARVWPRGNDSQRMMTNQRDLCHNAPSNQGRSGLTPPQLLISSSQRRPPCTHFSTTDRSEPSMHHMTSHHYPSVSSTCVTNGKVVSFPKMLVNVIVFPGLHREPGPGAPFSILSSWEDAQEVGYKVSSRLRENSGPKGEVSGPGSRGWEVATPRYQLRHWVQSLCSSHLLHGPSPTLQTIYLLATTLTCG